MKHRDRVVLQKIVSEIETGIIIFNDISYDDFLKNETIKRAICMTAINIGELIKVLTDDIRLKYVNIPWKAIAGFRDVAAHKYEALNMKDVYDTVHDDFQKLKDMINEILLKDHADDSEI